jgi:hypothetical protein
MKRVGDLFDAVADARTLVPASWRAARGKRDRSEVRQFLARLDAEVARLGRALRAGTFQFGAYRTFTIRDPKTRLIHAPPFGDRVVHHALVAVTGPVFERGASAHSYACRAGRGQHAALGQLQRWLRPGDWFWKADVAKFYDSVDHDLLRAQLARRFRERRLLGLFDRLLASYAHAPGKGLPIGALTSQYLGNFYLDAFDHWVNQSGGIHRYMRYMDDMLFVADRTALAAVRPNAAALLDGLGLRVKHDGILNRAELGVPWLGFVLYPDRTRLNRAGRQRLRRRFNELERANVSEAERQARGTALFAQTGTGRMTATGTTASGSVWFAARWQRPTDDAASRAPLGGDETSESPPRAEIGPRAKKACGGTSRGRGE